MQKGESVPGTDRSNEQFRTSQEPDDFRIEVISDDSELLDHPVIGNNS